MMYIGCTPFLENVWRIDALFCNTYKVLGLRCLAVPAKLDQAFSAKRIMVRVVFLQTVREVGIL